MNIEHEAIELSKLKGAALRAKYHEVVGTETKSNNKPYLIKRILQAMATRAPTSTKDAAPEPRETAKPARRTRERDPRIPAPGSLLEREYDGKTLKVKVLDDGFQFRGKTYRSLSAIAKEATGTIWNGLLFFNLISRGKRAHAG